MNIDLEADYFATQNKKRLITQGDSGITEAPIITVPDDVPPADESLPVKKKAYYLFYPDSVHNNYHNGEYIVELDGRTIRLKITNGVIVTDNELVKTSLIRSGFSFMYEKEK